MSINNTIKSIGPNRMMVIGVAAISILLVMLFLTTRLSDTDMSLLYGDLSSNDAGAVAAKLEQLKIPYKLSEDGTSVTVPSGEVGRARMVLAEEGLPGEASVGYEIFDEQSSFGTTDFVQNINQVRALEGELSKTIGTLKPVKTARIHLVLPKRQLFSKEAQPATASVFVKLRPGKELGREQVLSIQHMVATAVPQLKPTRVSIVDQSGKLLAKGVDDQDDPNSLFLDGTIEEMQLKYERRMSQMVQDLVGQIVGYDKVRANVSADLDFDRVSTNSEMYDPEGQVVRSTQLVEESEQNNEGLGPQGVTVQNSLPGLGAAGAGAGGAGSQSNRVEEVTNFEISKTVKNHIKESGEVRRLSVAVLVDGVYTDGEAEGERVYQPRSPEELEQIETLVRSAIGFDDNRGDSIEVINMQFAHGDVPDFTESIADNLVFGFEKSDLLDIAETITLAFVALLVVLLVLQPLVNKLIESMAAAGNADSDLENLIASQLENQPALTGPGGAGAMPQPANEGAMIDMDRVEGRVKESSVQKVNELVEKHPQETVSVLRNWLYQDD